MRTNPLSAQNTAKGWAFNPGIKSKPEVTAGLAGSVAAGNKIATSPTSPPAETAGGRSPYPGFYIGRIERL